MRWVVFKWGSWVVWDGVMEKYKEGLGKFSSHTRFEVGEDSTIVSVWHDMWCGDRPLKEVFLELYSIVSVKDASMVDYLELSSYSHKWNLSFIRASHDWKVYFFTSFFNLLYSIRFRWGGEDKFRWAPSKRGMFNVRSLYNVLVPHDSTRLTWNSIWQNKTSLKMAFFYWKCALGKIPTMDNLRKRHVMVVN
jgi:hypothetical protein